MSALVLTYSTSCGSPPIPMSFPEAGLATSEDGIPIRYDVEGLGSPALVFVHGWACDRTYWTHQVEHFKENHTVVAIDLPGHGESGNDRERWSMAAFGQDVAAVVDELQLDEVILVGHSMGGSVILEAASSLPNRVVGLVPVDTFFDVELKLSKEQSTQFLAPFRVEFAAFARMYIRDNMFTPETDPSLMEAIIADMSQAPPNVALGALEELLTYDTPSALQQIHAPIRCINTDKYVSRVDVARRYARSFDVVLFTGAGHFLMMEKPGAFNQTLSEIVSDLVDEDRKRKKEREK